MAFTNSFHSSAKGHAVKTAGKLSSIAAHNSRGYQSWDYSAGKITSIIGDVDTIVDDTRAFIDDTFADSRDRYNASQRRADRRITMTPFEYFDSNKKTDLAVETILQVADKDFWDQFRSDDQVTVGGKTYTRHTFDPAIQSVMDDIFKRQIAAYENIYTTHGDEILRRIESDVAASEQVVSDLGAELCERFAAIHKAKPKDRDKLIDALTDDEQSDYARYAAATDTLAAVAEMRLIDRVQNGQMHIKIINAAGHYDECCPHAHAVSVCYAEGFKKGMDMRLAKSVVLNRWSLTVIQDRMREIAQEEIDKHPEIFSGREIDAKQAGRNIDYTKEQIIRQRIAELEDQAILTEQIISNLQRSMTERYAELISDAIADVVSGSDDITNMAFLLAECDDERFAELTAEAQDLMTDRLMHVDVEPMLTGLDAAIGQAQRTQTGLSWERRQMYWEKYREISADFWQTREQMKSYIDRELDDLYYDKNGYYESYRDAMYYLNRTHNLFVALACGIWALIASVMEYRVQRQIDDLRCERRDLQEMTRDFSRFSRQCREQLKDGKRPQDNYMQSMENLVLTLDEYFGIDTPERYAGAIKRREDKDRRADEIKRLLDAQNSR